MLRGTRRHHVPFWIHLLGGPAQLTKSIHEITAILIHLLLRAAGLYRNELAWDTAVKSKGSGLWGSLISTKGCGNEQPEAAYKLSLAKTLGLYYHIPPTKAQQWLQVGPTAIQVLNYCKCWLNRSPGVRWKNNSHHPIHCFHEISLIDHLLIMQLNV